MPTTAKYNAGVTALCLGRIYPGNKRGRGEGNIAFSRGSDHVWPKGKTRWTCRIGWTPHQGGRIALTT